MPDPRTTEGELMNIYPRSGPIRGLLQRLPKGTAFNRALVGYTSFSRHYGICKWCRQPCEKSKLWHDSCARQMTVAKGAVLDIFKRPLIPKGPCEECGMPYKDISRPEIDHRIALSVAWEQHLLGERRWWRAWTIGNLRWLCRECHRSKTAEDLRLLARLRSPQKHLFDA